MLKVSLPYSKTRGPEDLDICSSKLPITIIKFIMEENTIPRYLLILMKDHCPLSIVHCQLHFQDRQNC